MLIDIVNLICTLLLLKIAKLISKFAETLQSDLGIIALLRSFHNAVT